jgi:DNA-directed RNA polymerase subunit omega
MARVTVEDCILQVPNRFELVMFASQRARDISAGAQITLDRDRDKNPVVALREIAEMKLDQVVLKDSLISGMQKHADVDKPEEVNEMAELEQELAAALAQGGPTIRMRTRTYSTAPMSTPEEARHAAPRLG